MKLLKRNLKPVWYCLYRCTEDLRVNNLLTGEKKVLYHEPVKIYCNISPATGYAQTYMFGTLESYDKIIIVDDINCPIDENTVLFIDKVPEFISKIQNSKESKDEDTIEWNGTPIYDYKVYRVSKSLNHISYAVRKVKVS